jgi:hypothetical protein
METTGAHKANLIWVVALAALGVDIVFAIAKKVGFDVSKFAIKRTATS